MNSIVTAAAALRRGEVSAVELCRRALASAESLQESLNLFVTLVGERALEQAARMDRELGEGIDRGPLHGIPIALKDVFETKGVLTTCGSRLFAAHVPLRDSAVAERLNAAGAVLIGKTGMHELAYGVTCSNPHFGQVRNPWNREHIPGGSSGGSGGAVAADVVFMAMGSDTGGSIRIPAAFCGTVGLKPTFGRVSRYGVMPLDFSLDHMGPLARTVRDAAIVLNILAGHDERDHTSSMRPVEDYVPGQEVSVSGLRIGIPINFYFDRIEAGIEANVRRVADSAAALGAELIPITVPDVAGLNAVGRVILMAEASACLEPYLARRQEFGADVIALLDQGRCLPATEYVQAQRLRRQFQLAFAKVFENVDCLLTPTTPNLASQVGQTVVEVAGEKEDARLAATRLVRGINLLGLPALAIPCGLMGGLPASVQLIGRAFEEATILRLGAALEDSGAVGYPGCPV
ncbi:MAG: Asp-tRNA(Asn)/Glu-tRNA(Gln) amidotransferase GatCAB subunit A [Acidobacteria bacterium]|nr:Asp-tRNA(Asn)/Glu-tRNA(Gln) amidotransferase GatCAB subunit A [Acidobacteriota bacterium]